jgi:hypothetical protein
LTLGARIEDPAAFVAKLNSLLVTLIQTPEDAPAEPAAAPEDAPAEPAAAPAEPAVAAPEPPAEAAPPTSDSD